MEFLFDVGIKSFFITGIGLVLVLLFKNQSAHLRHWLISCTLISLLFLPFATLIVPSIEVIPLPEKSTLTTIYQTPTFPTPTEVFSNDTFSEISTTVASSESPTSDKLVHLLPLFLLIWGTITLFLLGRMLFSFLTLYNISQRAAPMPTEGYQSFLFTNAQIRISDQINTPMTWGIFQPIILIPQFKNALNELQLKTILVHEQAHIERKDFINHLLTLFIHCFYWFNPIVWVLKKQQILEREKACDEWVMHKGWLPTDYASQLVAIARSLNQQSRFTQHMAIPLGGMSQIKKRVLAILDFDLKVVLPSRKTLWRYAGYFGCFIPFLAAISPINPVEEIPYLNQIKEEALAAPMPQLTLSLDQPQPKEKIASKSTPPTQNTFQLKQLVTKPISALYIPKRKESLDPLPSQHVFRDRDPIGLKGEWLSGNSQFKLWTYGEVTPLDAHPYFRFASNNGMVIVEETKYSAGKGKSFKFMITPAPYDGALVHNFYDGKPNAYSSYKKGNLLTFWLKNGDWVLLGRGHEKWEKKNMPDIIQQMRTLTSASIENDYLNWKSVIEKYQNLKVQRFLHSDELPTWKSTTLAPSQVGDYPLPLELVNVPSASEKASSSYIVGKNQPTKTTSGYGGRKGYGAVFGSMIQYNGPSQAINSFHFHVRYKRYKTVALEVNLYQIKDGQMTGKINPNPIQAELSLEEGWNTVHFPKGQSIFIDSDVFVTMKLVDTKPADGGIFLSLDKQSHGDLKSIIGHGAKDVWEGNFSFYLTIN